MNELKLCRWIFASAAGALVIVGCQAPQQRAHVQQIPQITKLADKATATPRVHRFRKPLRDEQARILRQLAVECDRLAGSVRGERISAEALTGSIPEAAHTDTGSLETALAQLAAAARSGDVRAIRSSHVAALTAYTRAQSRTAPPNP